MKILQLSRFGAPTDVVQLVDVDPADPGPGQLVVSIEAAPINPSDLNLIRGIYGVRPVLPAALAHHYTTALHLYHETGRDPTPIVPKARRALAALASSRLRAMSPEPRVDFITLKS